MRYWIFYYLAVFLKQAVFSRENGKKPFLDAKLFLKGKRHPVAKMNIILFMENEVLNIFSFKKFFWKSNIFGENGDRKFLGDTTIF